MIDWNSVDTVLLDMDGTLLDLSFDNYFWLEHVPKAYAAHHQLNEAQCQQALHGRFDSHQGTLDWYSLDFWSQQLEMDLAALKRGVQHLIRARPHALEFLQQLHRSPKKVLMVTNAHRKTLDIKMTQVDMSPWFDQMIVSHELEAAKEEQAFWQRLQQLHPFDPSRTLLIDDTERVLASAQQYGIGHLLLLLQPDSERPREINSHFRGIHHFDEIMLEGVDS